jgi:uncharacterized membrane protein
MSSLSASLNLRALLRLRALRYWNDAMKGYVTLGLAAFAGAALFEAALVPGLVVGGAAVLAPKVVPTLRRRLKPLLDAALSQPAKPAAAPRRSAAKGPLAALAGVGIKQAVAKTITFRIIVTALDFTSNLIVIGEAGTAAGLSTFAFVVGPLFYLAHETAWNHLSPSGGDIDITALLPVRPGSGREIKISRPLAKTITFRVIATAMDFTTIYVVVGDLATAAGLSAFGFVVGPFVYWGHEKAWDYYSGSTERPLALPAPASA